MRSGAIAWISEWHPDKTNHSMPDPMLRRKRLALAVLTALTFYLGYVSINGFSNMPYSLEANKRGVSLLARAACQFLEEGISGEEGLDEKATGFRLKGVSIVFRHGERMPILSREASGEGTEESKGEVDGNCAPFHDEHRRQFEVYRKRVHSDEFKYFLRLDPKFQSFKQVPHPSRCSLGNMTADGALQIVRLAGFLAKRYAQTSLFQAEEINATLQASPWPRTFQSAVAFSTAFFFPRNVTFPQVFLKQSPNTYFCMSEGCECPNARAWRHQYEKEHLEWYRTKGGIDLKAGARLATETMRIKGAKDPFQVIDVLLGYYICRRESLPCDAIGHCIKYKFFDQLVNSTTIQSEKMLKDRSSILLRLIAAEAQPILGYLATTIARLRHMPHTHLVRVYSGHDVTVGPLLKALGIPHIDPPHYAARIAFEIYERVGSASVTDSLFVRVMYDGFDRTAEVRFCPEHKLIDGLCPAKLFEEFAKYGIFTLAGYKNRKALCDYDTL